MNPQPSGMPESLSASRARCAADLAQWVAESDDFRAEYEELRDFSRNLHWEARLPDLDNEGAEEEWQDRVERMLLEMLEQAPSRLQPSPFGAWERPDWQPELLSALRREWLPSSHLEGDHYGPE